MFIGYETGKNETGSNKLYIENSDSPTPLIGGDFSTDEIYLNGKVGIGTSTPGSKLSIVGLLEYADNTAALVAGLTAGDLYRTGDL